MGIREAHSFARQAVDVRCLDLGRPVAADIAVTEIVREDDDDIGLLIGACENSVAEDEQGDRSDDRFHGSDFLSNGWARAVNCPKPCIWNSGSLRFADTILSTSDGAQPAQVQRRIQRQCYSFRQRVGTHVHQHFRPRTGGVNDDSCNARSEHATFPFINTSVSRHAGGVRPSASARTLWPFSDGGTGTPAKSH